MFGVGLGEIVVIAIVALLVLGPEKLPGLAQQLGRGLRDLRRTADDLQASFREAVAEDVRRPGAPGVRPASPGAAGVAAPPLRVPATAAEAAARLFEPTSPPRVESAPVVANRQSSSAPLTGALGPASPDAAASAARGPESK